MKLIDLINDLFDYREFQTDKLPKKIRFNNKEFVFVDNSYYNENGINIMAYVDNTLDLRVEIEIIEEDKEIKSLTIRGEDIMLGAMVDWLGLEDINEKEQKMCSAIEMSGIKINELIKAVNELKKGK